MFKKEILKDKKITVMGLGLLGRHLADIKFLTSCGADLIVTDLKNEDQLKKTIEKIKDLPIKLVLGKHRISDFKNRDFILKTAGAPKNSIYLKTARENKIPIEMDDSLFARYCPCPIIGVTGTRGKSTTTHLIYEILKKGLKNRRIYIAGNIANTATLPLITKVKQEDLVVLELSSWQLQGWHESKISPQISVFTNLYPDHLNYYRSMKDYLHDKKAIFKYQNPDDHLILNKDIQIFRELLPEINSQVVWFSKKDVPKRWQPKLIGDHNRENIAAAINVGRIFKIPMKTIKTVVEKFKNLPYRLEYVRTYKNIKFYNDSNSTTPEATIAALESFPKKKNIILIVGGADKKLRFDKLAKQAKTRIKSLIVFEGSAQEKIRKAVLNNNIQPVTYVDSMKEAVKQAFMAAGEGDIVLLSPAAASFGLFINEYDRGDQFIKEVKKLK